MVRDVEAIAADVIDQALQLRRGLGPGLLESVYETVLAAKLAEMGYSVFGKSRSTSSMQDCVSKPRSGSTLSSRKNFSLKLNPWNGSTARMPNSCSPI